MEKINRKAMTLVGCLTLFCITMRHSPCWAELPVWGTDLAQSTISAQESPVRIIVKLKSHSFLKLAANRAEAVSSFCLLHNIKLKKLLDYVDVFIAEAAAETVDTVIEKLMKSEDVEYAERDVRIHVNQVPNDPDFSKQWGLHNVGQDGGTVGADIDAPKAWDVTTGNNDVVVGVIDTGVDYNHVDLSANMWVNHGEIANNGIDDDGNGYVDDVYGINAINGSGDPWDDHGHGTHCSGIIGALGNNSIGVVGVNWNVKIMALKFLDANGSGWGSDAMECLNYAVMMKERYGVNIRVTSNSYGGGGFSQGMYDAISASKDADMLFVAASGNDSRNTDSYPNYPSNYDLDNIISVAATDNNDQLSWFSNYGQASVDLAAPGSAIYSSVPGNGYESWSGTSMACPYVSGTASLISSNNSSLTYREVRDSIIQNGDVLSSLTGKVQSGGRLNVYRSLGTAPPTPPAVGNFVFQGSWSGAGSGSDGWYVGDFNGDGLDDIFRYVSGSCGAEVFLSNGSKFQFDGCWSGAGHGTEGWYVNDFNGDGLDDIFRYVPGICGVEVFLSNGSAFQSDGCWSEAGHATTRWYSGDFDGDGKTDIFRYVPGRSGAEVFLNEY